MIYKISTILEIVSNFPSKTFLVTYFFTLYPHISRILAKFHGFRILIFKTMTFFEGKCSQNDDFKVKHCTPQK